MCIYVKPKYSADKINWTICHINKKNKGVQGRYFQREIVDSSLLDGSVRRLPRKKKNHVQKYSISESKTPKHFKRTFTCHRDYFLLLWRCLLEKDRDEEGNNKPFLEPRWRGHLAPTVPPPREKGCQRRRRRPSQSQRHREESGSLLSRGKPSCAPAYDYMWHTVTDSQSPQIQTHATTRHSNTLSHTFSPSSPHTALHSDNPHGGAVTEAPSQSSL